MFAERGAEFDLFSRGDVLRLAVDWTEKKRLFHPYEVLVIDRITGAFWQAGPLVLLTVLIPVFQIHNRLVLKLWRAAGSPKLEPTSNKTLAVSDRDPTRG